LCARRGARLRARPIVAVSADRVLRGAHPNHTAGEKYLVAVVDGAGALAFVLPALGARQPVDAIVASLDGLLLTGSHSNVEPHHYGGPASAADTLHDAARDATVLPLVRAAIDAGVPVLAICRGMQELNVAYGGTLHQRLHASVGFHDHRERDGDPLERSTAPHTACDSRRAACCNASRAVRMTQWSIRCTIRASRGSVRGSRSRRARRTG
jgi:putative glutamine amidotransferase